MLSVCVVLSFVVGVTISIGLDVTCDSLRQQNMTQTRYVDRHIPVEKLEVEHCSRDERAPLLLMRYEMSTIYPLFPLSISIQL